MRLLRSKNLQEPARSQRQDDQQEKTGMARVSEAVSSAQFLPFIDLLLAKVLSGLKRFLTKHYF